jgi:multidrug efflux pump subunit AcrB
MGTVTYLAQKNVLSYNPDQWRQRRSSGRGFIRLETGLCGDESQGAAAMARSELLTCKTRCVRCQIFILPAVRGLGANMALRCNCRTLVASVQWPWRAHDKFLQLANQNPVSRVRNNNLVETPQFNIQIDDRRASLFGLSLPASTTRCHPAMGGAYVNDASLTGAASRRSTHQGRALQNSRTKASSSGMVTTARARWCRFQPSQQRLV